MAAIARSSRPLAKSLVESCKARPSSSSLPSLHPKLVTQKCRRVGPASSRSFRTSAPSLEKLYAQSHEWIDVSEDKTTATLGISDHASRQLGDIVFVELPTTDLELAPHDVVGCVESVKSASDIYSPVAAVVTEVNIVLEETPGTMNSGPETDGWMAKLRLKEGTVERSVKEGILMNLEQYKDFVERTIDEPRERV